ncbi:unnamed protein product [Ostreobium quekettii]|uniref:Translation initiation factor IF-2, chloroplastic n=1 Tax=Ostreobium quekettii TaxID=121088 RepID=A0A8S1J818_9CHLO|nr:unnamed protein product [Ostreobium quekettii]
MSCAAFPTRTACLRAAALGPPRSLICVRAQDEAPDPNPDAAPNLATKPSPKQVRRGAGGRSARPSRLRKRNGSERLGDVAGIGSKGRMTANANGRRVGDRGTRGGASSGNGRGQGSPSVADASGLGLEVGLESEPLSVPELGAKPALRNGAKDAGGQTRGREAGGSGRQSRGAQASDQEGARRRDGEKKKQFAKRGAQGKAWAGREDREKKGAGRGRREAEGRREGFRMTVERRRKARQQRKLTRMSKVTVDEGEDRIVVGSEGMAVTELAKRLAISPAEVVKALFMKGIMVQITQTLDRDAVTVVATEKGVELVNKDEEAVESKAVKTSDFIDLEDIDHLQERPPVVTVMGHVDHGKTTLLDYIRQAGVAAGEAGGITQAIGAYTCTVTVDDEEKRVCFLDTPGHEAFSAMRARGARATDIAIVIVAATDGVQPQTKEAVNHAKAAKVPIIVAINKMDVEGANPDRVKQELGELELVPEEWGGSTPMVEISAKTGQGIDDLLELIVLMSEVELELLANPDRSAAGMVIEAHLDRKSGPAATVLVQNGTLHVGDVVVSGASYGKVRSLQDWQGSRVEEAGPASPVQMFGLNSVPTAGDEFAVCLNEAEAREQAQKAAEVLREAHLVEQSGGGSMVTLSSLASIDESLEGIQRLNILLKGDTSGSVEAVKAALNQLPQDSVMLRFLHTGTGDITESDLDLAQVAEGMVVGFNVQAAAKRRGVEVRTYTVIYDLLDDIRAAMEGRLSPVDEKVPLGKAEVRAVFGSGDRCVAGCMVTEGKVSNTALLVVKRGKKKVMHEGLITSLRRVKDNVTEVSEGVECGIACDFKDWKEGDVIEAFELVAKRMSLEEATATPALDLAEFLEEAAVA